MLVALSITMFVCFIFLLVSGKMSAVTTLILVPTLFAIIGGFAPEMGAMVLKASARSRRPACC